LSFELIDQGMISGKTADMNEEEKTVTCPLHLSAFKLDTGVPQNQPAEVRPEPSFVLVETLWISVAVL
jgi:nitrite reductase/ring-hydroxylating ferredoxin subunit